MKTFEEKKAALKQDYERKLKTLDFEQKMSEFLPEIERTVYRDSSVTFKADNKQEVTAILKTFKPTNRETVIKTATSEETLKTPYQIKLENPCQITQFTRFEMYISYVSNDIGIWIKLPVEIIKDFVYQRTRKITSSEHHYFTNTSGLHQKKVACYIFKNSNVIKWYGGSQTQKDLTYIKNVIDFLKGKNVQLGDNIQL